MENVCTVIFFNDGRELMIRGFEEADKFMEEHAGEIFLTYTDWTGKEIKK